MSILGIPEATLSERGGVFTASEIAQQPSLWHDLGVQAGSELGGIGAFMKKASEDAGRIVLTGAGTSAFIGLSLRKAFMAAFDLPVEAVPTTDIVSHPDQCFLKGETILLVSFARSGNSPESLGAVTMADQICGKCYHLIITCSKEGELANIRTANPKYVFLLPEKANDKSLAMTSSYSGMLLSGLLIARHKSHGQNIRQLELLCRYGEIALQKHGPVLREVACQPFRRAVFLGSGPLSGVARECHLKLQELTDGMVICKNDSYLGFRHGPKAVVDEHTLMFYLSSNVPYVQRYENDFLRSMAKGRPPMIEILVSETANPAFAGGYNLVFSENGKGGLDEDFLCICSVLPGQLLGFYKSLEMGFSPDAPSKSGAISRVVEGVSIYPVV